MLIALVTGGGRGIGLQVVHGLARRGFTCLVGAREPERAQQASAELNASGHDVQSIRLDVTDAISLTEAAELIGHQFGRLDVLVNNAGVLVIAAPRLRAGLILPWFGRSSRPMCSA